MKVILAIPAYNCEKQIQRVVQELKTIQDLFTEIWIVDNGSSDSTEIAAKNSIIENQLSNTFIYRNLQNVNLGGTHKKVFSEATAIGATHVAILHGDNQAKTEELKTLLSISENNGGQTVLGSRFMPGSRLIGYSSKRILGNKILNYIYSGLSRRKLSDLGSGINLFKLSDLNMIPYKNFGNGLTFNYQLILGLISSNSDFRYQPITWSETDQQSNAKNIKVFSRALLILLRWKIGNKSELVFSPLVEWELI